MTATPPTLAKLTLQVARLVMPMVRGSATANEGVNTQITDTVFLTQTGDIFAGGTIWFNSGTNNGLVRPVVTYDSGNHRLTFAAVTANPAVGDKFEVADARIFTYLDFKQAVNNGLREMGEIMAKDEATAVVSAQEVYALPAGVWNVAGVEVVNGKGLATETRHVSTHWEEREGKLIFDRGYAPTDGSAYLRILYRQFHADLAADTDVISDSVDEQSLIRLAAKHALRIALMHYRKTREEIPDWLNERVAASQSWVPNRGLPLVEIHSA